jgi:hypothetical protein
VAKISIIAHRNSSATIKGIDDHRSRSRDRSTPAGSIYKACLLHRQCARFLPKLWGRSSSQ